MLLLLYFYLLPAKAGLGDYETPSVRVCMRVCMHACMRLSHFYINLYTSFIYEDMFTKFAQNASGCENMSVKNVLILKNNMATIADCLKIIDMF